MMMFGIGYSVAYCLGRQLILHIWHSMVRPAQQRAANDTGWFGAWGRNRISETDELRVSVGIGIRLVLRWISVTIAQE